MTTFSLKSGLSAGLTLLHPPDLAKVLAQEMLLLLGQLAYNLTSWVRNGLASCQTRLQQFGMLRMIQDAFHISGLLAFNADGHIVQISLNQAHELAAAFIDAFAFFLAHDGTVANLHQI